VAPASLNTFVGVVGPSSAGKGGSLTVAAEVLEALGGVPFDVLPLGSGEAIAHAYAKRIKGNPKPQRIAESALFELAEVDTLAGLTERRGGTLLPELRKAWSGERVGFHYVDPTKRLPLEPHTYRLCLWVGIQPEKAGVLLNDAAGGTPQRFVWLPVQDLGALSFDHSDEAPDPLRWEAPELSGGHIMGVCEEARRVILAAREAGLRGEVDALNGHALLCRLKVAAGLALLDRRVDVDAQDWQLAGHVMDVSQATRSHVVAVLATEARRANVARAKAEGERSVVAADVVADAITARAARWIVARLQREREGMFRAELRRAAESRNRRHVDDALEALVALGQVAAEHVDHHGQVGTRYRYVGGAK
jgi:hypothetical protein